MTSIGQLLTAGALLYTVACSSAGQITKQPEPVSGPPPQDAVDPVLSIDPKVTYGALENGVRYIVRVNKKPEKRAELRLVVNAGSVLEDEDQQGLAHFLEHMAFNGTKRFPKQNLIDFIERVGMRLGPDLNGYTSFDETVYMLQVPTDSTNLVVKGFDILEDWATSVAFEEEEIDKERGVVIEEWRLGRGAGARMRDKQFPILFKGSRYAERLPIGKKAVLDTFSYDTVRRFYRDWYRPDLISVVAVGDFDAAWIEGLILERFSSMPPDPNPRERVYYPVPGHDETLFAPATDPEASSTSVAVYYKQPVRPQGTASAFRQRLVEALYSLMLNARLNELTKKPDPPFLGAGTGQGRWIRTKEFYYLGASVKQDGLLRGMEAVLTEGERVRRHGFTSTELDREKTNMLRRMERAYHERDKMRSRQFASEYIRHLLTNEPIAGIEAEYELHKQLLPGIGLEEVNRLAGEWITDRDRVVMLSGPEKADVSLPTNQELTAVIGAVRGKEIAPYEDAVAGVPLIDQLPAPRKIVAEREIPEIGVTEWTLSNGIRVALKPTDFKNDQILFRSFSPGGHSLADDDEYIPASTATSVLREGGLGAFNQIELRKKLAGKVVSVSPWIGSLQEGVRGSASPQDVETMFQLIYLTFTAPRADSSAFVAYKQRVIGMLENRDKDPRSAFSDTVQVVMARHHHRARPLTKAVMEELDLPRSLAIYRDRFADASDFTFTFVGNLDLKRLRPLVEMYLGGLPGIGRDETWRDTGMRPPQGTIERTVRRGIEPKSQVRMEFTGPAEWSRRHQYELGSMRRVLQIKLREVVREEESGTYGIGVGASISRWPYQRFRITIRFGCDPERVEELVQTVITQIDSLKAFGTTDKYVNKVKENQRRSREVSLKENGFWQNAIQSAYVNGEDLTSILEYDRRVKALTAETIQETAAKYFTMNNYAKFVLYPQEGTEARPPEVE